MSGLPDFLLERIDEEESAARLVNDGPGDIQRAYYDRLQVTTTDGKVDRVWLTINPARVLAECEAKRRIVRRESGWTQQKVDAPPHFRSSMDGEERIGIVEWDREIELSHDESAAFIEQWYEPSPPGANLRDLGSVYADHPDYREEWKP